MRLRDARSTTRRSSARPPDPRCCSPPVERRDEGIGAGPERLARSPAGHGGLAPDSLADALFVVLPPAADGPDDDTALVVVRL
ncbi:hypothetical protein ACIQMR_05585 [Streptomyces sp. NPDC091376]|uniref:hypothetical protein n=1 Tax=Streptomyces sp. NPDC091376 TaxID=3365994 RepID=UPI00382D7B47